MSKPKVNEADKLDVVYDQKIHKADQLQKKVNNNKNKSHKIEHPPVEKKALEPIRDEAKNIQVEDSKKDEKAKARNFYRKNKNSDNSSSPIKNDNIN